MPLPAEIGDYTDFYAGIHHATACRQIVPARRAAAAELQVPAGRLPWPRLIGASSGTPGAAPERQRKPAKPRPRVRPDAGVSTSNWNSASGSGRATSSAKPMPCAAGPIAGFCLLNDWSARDIQAWEYQPLGPFLAKNFLTTISPWIVTAEALAPFRWRSRRGPSDPATPPHLWDEADQARERSTSSWRCSWTPSDARDGLAPQRLSVGNSRHLYWTRRADGGAPHQRRLQSACRRSIRLGNHLIGGLRRACSSSAAAGASRSVANGEQPPSGGRRRDHPVRAGSQSVVVRSGSASVEAESSPRDRGPRGPRRRRARPPQAPVNTARTRSKSSGVSTPAGGACDRAVK